MIHAAPDEELPELPDEPLLLDPDDWLLTLLGDPLELLDWLDWLELLPELGDELLGEEPVVPDEDDALLSEETLDPLGTLEPLPSDDSLLPLPLLWLLADVPDEADEPLLEDPDEPLELLPELGDEPTVPDEEDGWLSEDALETDEPDGSPPLETLDPLESLESPLRDDWLDDEPELLLPELREELGDELLGLEPMVPLDEGDEPCVPLLSDDGSEPLGSDGKLLPLPSDRDEPLAEEPDERLERLASLGKLLGTLNREGTNGPRNGIPAWGSGICGTASHSRWMSTCRCRTVCSYFRNQAAVPAGGHLSDIATADQGPEELEDGYDDGTGLATRVGLSGPMNGIPAWGSGTCGTTCQSRWMST